MVKHKNDLPDDVIEKLKIAKRKKKEFAAANYIIDSISEGALPLPILNRIHKKQLLLSHYGLDQDNLAAIVGCLTSYIPNSLKKITLNENNLSDEGFALILEGLSKCQPGLETIGCI